jgi:transposase
VFVDESGFYLLPAIVRTWAPMGQTPRLVHYHTKDHISTISGITFEGELLIAMQERAFTASDCVRFLKHLVRQIGGKVLVIWDGSPIHRARVVKSYLRDEANGRVHLEPFPGYAPDLNPDEGVWNYLKYVELKNVCCATLAELRREMRNAVARLRRKPEIIKACIRQPGLISD